MSVRFAVLVLATMVVVGVSWGAVSGKERKLKVVKTVVIDPGHGGANKGALGYNGVYEKEITLQVALKVRKLLEAQTTAVVLLTREDDRDVPLVERTAIANDARADLFISLHCNSAFSKEPSGFETYVLSEAALSEESRKLSWVVVEPKGLYASAADSAAAAVVKEMLQFRAQRDAKVFGQLLQASLLRWTKGVDRGVKELSIVILRGAEMPGVVVELGFISNPLEAENLCSPSYQWKLAHAVVDAIVKFDKLMVERGGLRSRDVSRVE